MAAMPGYNDGVLVISLLYLAIDMQYQWDEFASCRWPIHRWLIGSYVFILAFRGVHALGAMHSQPGGGDFLLNLRHKEKLPLVLVSLTWMLVLPLFAIWTGLGTFWLWDSKRVSSDCLPMGMPLMFIIAWQLMSYAWMLIHFTLAGVAWVLERRLSRREESIRAMEDPDMIARWGQVSDVGDYTSALSTAKWTGLTPDDIKALPECLACDAEPSLGEEYECSICLNEVSSSDAVRKLPNCGHTFHRCCIDLWLLRNAHCPLCKQEVQAPSKPAFEMERWHV